MPYLERDGSTFVLDLGRPDEVDTENRFSPDWLVETQRCLDEVEASAPGPCALVTTGTGKFYSNGFEPERFAADPAEVSAYLLAGQAVFARILALPMPTVAAVQGHAFAGGLILAIAHDARVMRADRGYLCLPEIDLGLPIPGGMVDLLTARLPRRTAHEAILTGRRYDADDALAHGLVDVTAPLDDVMTVALARAAGAAHTAGAVLGAMKRQLYAGVLASLSRMDTPTEPIGDRP